MRTAREHRYLLLITDYRTIMLRTVPLSVVTTTEVSKQFVNNWVFSYGSLIDLIASNGRQFTSKFFQELLQDSKRDKLVHKNLSPKN